MSSAQLQLPLRYSPWWVLFWILFILFCSTDAAGRWAVDSFEFFWAFLSPGGPGDVSSKAQKLFHVFLFVVLSWLVFWLPSRGRACRFLWATLFCISVGFLSEGAQLYFATRHPSLSDALLNGFSGTLAALLWVRIHPPDSAQ